MTPTTHVNSLCNPVKQPWDAEAEDRPSEVWQLWTALVWMRHEDTCVPCHSLRTEGLWSPWRPFEWWTTWWFKQASVSDLGWEGKMFHFQLSLWLQRKYPDMMSHRISILFYLWPNFHRNETLCWVRLALESLESPCVQLPDGCRIQRLMLELCDSDIIIVVVRALNYTRSQWP